MFTALPKQTTFRTHPAKTFLATSLFLLVRLSRALCARNPGVRLRPAAAGVIGHAESAISLLDVLRCAILFFLRPLLWLLFLLFLIRPRA